MNCLVLGGAGFMGSHLCEALLQSGHRVRIFEKKEANFKNIEPILGHVDLVKANFSNIHILWESLKETDIVFHLIGTTLPQNSNADIPFDLTSNLNTTVRLLDGCVQAKVKKVIFASSGGTVYGIPQQIPISEEHPTNPICSYGIHKLAIEKYLQLYHHLYGLQFPVLRISNPFGSRQNTNANQGAVAIFLKKAQQGEPIEIWGDGSVVRDYIYISDVVSAFLAAGKHPEENKIFNIGSGVGHTLLEIVSIIEKEIGKRLDVRFKSARKIDVPINILSIEQAKGDLKWRPEISLEHGIAKMLRSDNIIHTLSHSVSI